jgi:hypothetical protein
MTSSPWVKTAVGRALSPKGSFPARPRIRSLGHELSVEMSDATTASDWLPTFEFGLANDSSCLKRRREFPGQRDALKGLQEKRITLLREMSNCAGGVSASDWGVGQAISGRYPALPVWS